MSRWPFLESGRNLLLEMLVVFVGVLAAFWVENYRESAETQARAERILEALQIDIQDQLDWAAPWYEDNESRRLSWISERNQDPHVPPFYVRMSGIPGHPDTTWNAALATDALRVLDPELVRQIGLFYYESDGIKETWNRYLDHTERVVLPVEHTGPSEFFDSESGRYTAEVLVNLRMLDEVWFITYDRWVAWPMWMTGEIQDYVDDLHGTASSSLICALSTINGNGTLVMAGETRYADIDWTADSFIEKRSEETDDLTGDGVCWTVDDGNRRSCRAAVYYENLALRSERFEYSNPTPEFFRTQRDESGCALIFGIAVP